MALEPKSGSDVRGSVVLTEVEGGVRVAVTAENAPRPGLHGLHFHEHADCSAPDAESAGEHLDPEGQPHGLLDVAERHFGDLGNIEIGPNGRGMKTTVIEGASLERGDPLTLIGSALVLHAEKDTGEQPSGASGARIACAEINLR